MQLTWIKTMQCPECGISEKLLAKIQKISERDHEKWIKDCEKWVKEMRKKGYSDKEIDEML